MQCNACMYVYYIMSIMSITSIMYIMYIMYIVYVMYIMYIMYMYEKKCWHVNDLKLDTCNIYIYNTSISGNGVNSAWGLPGGLLASDFTDLIFHICQPFIPFGFDNGHIIIYNIM